MTRDGDANALDLLVGSDLHGAQHGLKWFCERAEEIAPDAIVFLGDFTTFGPMRLLREAVNSLRGLAPACFLLPGNCDPREALVELDIAAFDDVKHLHKKTAYAGGYYLAGLGGSTPTPAGNTPLERPEDGFADHFGTLLPADIWVLHNPVQGFRDSVSRNVHAGSESLRMLWDDQDPKPLLVLSGHIHEAAGTEESQGTTFVNPGSLAGLSAARITLVNRTLNVEMIGE